MKSYDRPIIRCELFPETRKKIRDYAKALQGAAHSIGSHGLSEKEFQDSGIFRSAIEHLRGVQAASTSIKRAFVDSVLKHMENVGAISRWEFTGAGERHDYQVELSDGKVAIIETKGCLDGNNTNIFERPPQADEFIIWSLCQNPGADPRKNAWSGIHVRLGAEIIHRKQKVDGLVIWDMLCGTAGRPCPKFLADSERATVLFDRKLPPPCFYLFPRSIPDPRNNPHPKPWRLEEVGFLHALHKTFQGNEDDVVEIVIECKMEEAETQRRTRFVRNNVEIICSGWTSILRATR